MTEGLQPTYPNETRDLLLSDLVFHSWQFTNGWKKSSLQFELCATRNLTIVECSGTISRMIWRPFTVHGVIRLAGREVRIQGDHFEWIAVDTVTQKTAAIRLIPRMFKWQLRAAEIDVDRDRMTVEISLGCEGAFLYPGSDEKCLISLPLEHAARVFPGNQSWYDVGSPTSHLIACSLLSLLLWQPVITPD